MQIVALLSINRSKEINEYRQKDCIVEHIDRFKMSHKLKKLYQLHT